MQALKKAEDATAQTQTTEKEPAAVEETKTGEDVGAKKESEESKRVEDEAAVSLLVGQGVLPRAGGTLIREGGCFVGDWRAASLYSGCGHSLYSWYGHGQYSWCGHGLYSWCGHGL